MHKYVKIFEKNNVYQKSYKFLTEQNITLKMFLYVKKHWIVDFY